MSTTPSNAAVAANMSSSRPPSGASSVASNATAAIAAMNLSNQQSASAAASSPTATAASVITSYRPVPISQQQLMLAAQSIAARAASQQQHHQPTLVHAASAQQLSHYQQQQALHYQQQQYQHPLSSSNECSSDDEDEEDSETDEEECSDEDDAMPPLIPPFRFAIVETCRSVVAHQQQHLTPVTTSLKSLKPITVNTSGLSNTAASSSVLPLGGPSLTTALSTSTSTSSSSSIPSGASTPKRGAMNHERRGSIGQLILPASSLSSITNIPSATAVSSSTVTTAPMSNVLPKTSPLSSTSHSSPSATPTQQLVSIGGSQPQLLSQSSQSFLPQSSPPTSPSRHRSSTAAASSFTSLPDHSLYRGAYPTLKNLAFLSRLKLKTIVSITPEPPTMDLREWCKGGGKIGFYNQPTPVASSSTSTSDSTSTAATSSSSATSPIKLYHYPTAKYSEAVTLTNKQVIQVLQILINTDNLPAYIHCTDGCNNTSLIVACLRKLQGWSMIPIYAELLRFSRDANGVADTERAFIERFNHNLNANGTSVTNTTSGKESKNSSSTQSNNNILLRIPCSLPNWLWSGSHLLSHPLGLKLYDMHVPSFLAVHAKLLGASSDTNLAGLSVAGTQAAISASVSQQASAAQSSASSASSSASLPPHFRLVDEDDGLWNGSMSYDEPFSNNEDAQKEEEEKARKKEKKKKKEKEKAEKAALEAAANAAGGAPTTDKPAVTASTEDDTKTAATSTTSSAVATDSKPAVTSTSQVECKESSDATTSSSATAATSTTSTSAIVPMNEPKVKSRSNSVTVQPAAVEEEKKSAPAASPTASVPPPDAAVTAPLSHPGEYHSLYDLEKSAWNRPVSYIKSDMLFLQGSWDELEEMKRVCDDDALLTTTNSAAASQSHHRRWQEFDHEEQFVELADDPDEKFTHDEFDSDVSLLVASLALEGFTMNHKITRPMQLFHRDQGQA